MCVKAHGGCKSPVEERVCWIHANSPSRHIHGLSIPVFFSPWLLAAEGCTGCMAIWDMEALCAVGRASPKMMGIILIRVAMICARHKQGAWHCPINQRKDSPCPQEFTVMDSRVHSESQKWGEFRPPFFQND